MGAVQMLIYSYKKFSLVVYHVSFFLLILNFLFNVILSHFKEKKKGVNQLLEIWKLVKSDVFIFHLDIYDNSVTLFFYFFFRSAGSENSKFRQYWDINNSRLRQWVWGTHANSRPQGHGSTRPGHHRLGGRGDGGARYPHPQAVKGILHQPQWWTCRLL